MDADHGPDFFKDGFKRFPRQLPENCVEYVLAIIDPQLETRKLLSELELVRKSAVQACERLTSDYIWQRGGFQLQVKTENGLNYLHGTTDYGDSVEDEWLIVYLLRDITLSRPKLWARVSDSDGEFLLIEAANVVPKWLSPEVDRNRAWINQGQLKIIALEAGGFGKRSLSLSEAVQALRGGTEATMHSETVEKEAFYRLQKYPDQVTEALHYSMLHLPRKLAHLIHARPATIAAAVEAFYLRNPISEKTLSLPVADLHYPPEDLVDSSVKFSKVLFAQLKSQHFRPPTHWEKTIEIAEKNAIENEDAEKHLQRLSMGMKLACGYEMLTSDAHSKDNRVVREYAILLEDLEADLQEGEAALPSNGEMSKWPHHGRNDDESWLDINFEDFEKELDGAKSAETEKNSGFGSATAHADLQKIVSRFESFLNDENAGIDGAEQEDMDEDDDVSDSEDEDVDVDFDEARFAKIMQDMLGLKSQGHSAMVSNSKLPGGIVQEADSDAEEEDHSQIQKLAAEIEAELNEHGALQLDPVIDSSRLLQNTAKDKGKSQSTHEESGSDDDNDEIDVDYNLAKNLLESFKSQAGLAGPASNILGMMGMQLPRDEGDDDLPGRK